MMKKLIFILMTVLTVMGISAKSSAEVCGSLFGGEDPFPLGSKAPLPWEEINGYWSDAIGNEIAYKIEVIYETKDNTRYVSVSLLNRQTDESIASGVGVVRSNSWDLWARVRGEGVDYKLRLQAFYPKVRKDSDTRILVVTLKDMVQNSPDDCMARHVLRKVDGLERRTSTGSIKH